MGQNVCSHSRFWGKNMTVAPQKDALMGIAGVQPQPTLTPTKNLGSVLTEVRDLIPLYWLTSSQRKTQLQHML